MMISGIVPGRSLATAVAVGALLSVAAISGAMPARAEENTNMFNSMLGFFGMHADKEQDAIDYEARPPLVVPPNFNLPPPKKVARSAAWPKDPDAAALRRREMDSRRPAPQITPNTNVEMSQSELQRRRGELPKDGSPDDCQAGAGTPICLYTPWKALTSLWGGSKSDTVQPGPEPQRKYLTEPPPGYREATEVPKAPVDAPKEQPDAADAGASIWSRLWPQRPKTSTNN